MKRTRLQNEIDPAVLRQWLKSHTIGTFRILPKDLSGPLYDVAARALSLAKAVTIEESIMKYTYDDDIPLIVVIRLTRQKTRMTTTEAIKVALTQKKCDDFLIEVIDGNHRRHVLVKITTDNERDPVYVLGVPCITIVCEGNAHDTRMLREIGDRKNLQANAHAASTWLDKLEKCRRILSSAPYGPTIPVLEANRCSMYAATANAYVSKYEISRPYYSLLTFMANTEKEEWEMIQGLMKTDVLGRGKISKPLFQTCNFWTKHLVKLKKPDRLILMDQVLKRKIKPSKLGPKALTCQCNPSIFKYSYHIYYYCMRTEN